MTDKNYSDPTYSKIILAGNPNVGKSTLFNLITGKKVHTGNWSGKTVSVSTGYGVHNNLKYLISDLPGIASLSNPSAEELDAFDSIIKGDYDCCVIVADATNLIPSLSLAIRILELTPRCVLCVNLCDEAIRQGITIDKSKLEFILGIPVILASAKRKKGISELFSACEKVSFNNISPVTFSPLYSDSTENFLASFSCERHNAIARLYSDNDNHLNTLKRDMALTISRSADKIAHICSHKAPTSGLDSKLDKIFCSPIWGIPTMLCLLAVVLYLTIVASAYPSELLSLFFSNLEPLILALLSPFPDFISKLLVYGVYSTTATVVSVMLPPMVIFFPFFTLLEDLGYLPRVAFNLDNAFKKCGSCGKQALTMCMGLGCNAIGVTQSAIIPSKKQRLIAILTNSFTPCNGRFAALIIASTFVLGSASPLKSGIFISLVLAFSYCMTFLSSLLLSKTILPEAKSTFVLDLPPFRRVRVLNVIFTSLIERSASILLRAVAISAPIGGVIFVLNYFNLLSPLASFLNPIATLMGLDGTILLAFILSFPANEMTLPIAAMLYSGTLTFSLNTSQEAILSLFASNGWSSKTALCFIIFTLMHWPCSATLVSIQKQTKSLGWSILSVLLPALFGFVFCFLANVIYPF